MGKRPEPGVLTQADVVNGAEAEAVRQILGSMTPGHLEELVRWSVRVSRAAYAKGWRADSGVSLADWIRRHAGAQVQ